MTYILVSIHILHVTVAWYDCTQELHIIQLHSEMEFLQPCKIQPVVLQLCQRGDNFALMVANDPVPPPSNCPPPGSPAGE